MEEKEAAELAVMRPTPALSAKTNALAAKSRKQLGPGAGEANVADRLLLEGEALRRRKQLRLAAAHPASRLDPTPLITELAKAIESERSIVDRLYP